ncbi:MAG: secondary thiamine-phosphate synthase enzyme YjbQ [Candidatus Omnitrophota bacterium]
MSHFKTISVKSSRGIQLIDITRDVTDYIAEQKVSNGIILVYTPHTTAAVTINENADPAVTADIEAFLHRHIPHEPYFKHAEGNSPSHIMSGYFSASETLIIDSGNLVLGTWQGIYFCEFDGPRNRKVHLKIMEDK